MNDVTVTDVQRQNVFRNEICEVRFVYSNMSNVVTMTVEEARTLNERLTSWLEAH